MNGVPFNQLHPKPSTPPPGPPLPPNPAANGTTIKLSYDLDTLHKDMTVVTAYFNLGNFQKGDTQPANFTPYLYHSWIHVFARVENPVIAYFEEDEDIQQFRRIRGKYPESHTKIYKVSRDQLWAFGLLSKIRNIYSKEGYPHYHPGTVVPEYSAAMHAKYELVHRSVVENPYRTRYFASVDVGLFRSIWEGSNEPAFWLYTPPDFDEAKVAYGEVFNRSLTIQPRQIFILNKEWVCGCMFVGRVDTLAQWTLQYMNATERYIQQEVMNTDQQVVYAMANEAIQHKVQMQVYPKPAHHEAWFHLGYTCMEQGNKIRTLLKQTQS